MAEKIDLVAEADRRIVSFMNGLATELGVKIEDPKTFSRQVQDVLSRSGLRLVMYGKVDAGGGR